MPQIEFEGKNIDDAVSNACKKLNCDKNNLKFDILSSGSTGIFGLIGAKKAKIRVIENFQPPQTVLKTDSSASTRKQVPGDGIKSLVDEAFNGTEKKTAYSRPAKPKNPPKETEPTQEPAITAPYVYPEGPVISGRQMLQNVLDSITDGASVSIATDSDRVIYRIEGGNSALLIGKRGQTLDAMQYLIDKIVNKQSDERVRIQIDIEGYLETRKASLESLALRLAEKAKKTGKPSTISQMTAHDRRIVHLTLKDDHTVKTRSIGEGYYRRLVIFPKKRKFRKNTKYDSPEAK